MEAVADPQRHPPHRRGVRRHRRRGSRSGGRHQGDRRPRIPRRGRRTASCGSAIVPHVVFPGTSRKTRSSTKASQAVNRSAPPAAASAPAIATRWAGRSPSVSATCIAPDFPRQLGPHRRRQEAAAGRRPGRRSRRGRDPRQYPGLCRATEAVRLPTRRPSCSTSIEGGKKMLFEPQGPLLDIDHGTFPFVTSSNSSGVGVSSGSGVPGRWIERVDRRGEGLLDPRRRRPASDRAGQRHRASTSATAATNMAPSPPPRRCGWFDAVAARYTAGCRAWMSWP